MPRSRSARLLALAALAAPAMAATRAAAAPAEGRHVVVVVPPAPRAAPSAAVSRVIYLERCTGGCAIRVGASDARTSTSMIPMKPAPVIGEFANTQGLVGAAADGEWAQIVRCMTEVYSPYGVVVTDVKPGPGQAYHEAIIAGRPDDIGFASDILGVAPLASDCRAIDNVISFSFANQHPPGQRVVNICWTAAQESAHAYGLDHEFAFSSNRSACSDPMTYRNDCGGEKFFRDQDASCGETQKRSCQCGASQNSHRKLLSVFGAGTPATASPTVSLTTPAAADRVLGSVVVADAGAQRGVARVEARFNGFAWAHVPGVAFLRSGQPDPATYSIPIPAALPDGIIDVAAVAYDDLGAVAESAAVTVTKGAPCSTAATCAMGQRCEAGKCFWDPPSGELGEACAYSPFCKSLLCHGDGGAPVCSQPCNPDAAESCDTGSECARLGSDGGVCALASGAGCCAVDRSGRGGWLHAGIAAVLLGLLRRRRGTR
jgi:hypothetical protein